MVSLNLVHVALCLVIALLLATFGRSVKVVCQSPGFLTLSLYLITPPLLVWREHAGARVLIHFCSGIRLFLSRMAVGLSWALA